MNGLRHHPGLRAVKPPVGVALALVAVLAGGCSSLALQRRAALAGIDEQRVATLAEVDVFGQKSLDAATARALEVVDHLAWRAAQLLGGLLVLGALLAALLSRWLRRDGRAAVTGSAHEGEEMRP